MNLNNCTKFNKKKTEFLKEIIRLLKPAYLVARALATAEKLQGRKLSEV